MKKFFSLFLLIVGIICLTGCETKTQVLNCKFSGQNSGIEYDGDEIYTYEGKSIKELKLVINFHFDAFSDDEIVKMYEDLKKLYDNTEAGVSSDTRQEGKVVITTIIINPKEFDGKLDYTDQDLQYLKSNYSIDYLKKNLEKQSYTCSIEGQK